VTKKKVAKTEPTLDDFFGDGVEDELKDIASCVPEVGRCLEHAEACNVLARFFTWAAQRATHDAALAAQKKPVSVKRQRRKSK